jgi:hypothetical protein
MVTLRLPHHQTVNENAYKGRPHIDKVQSVKAMGNDKQICREGGAVRTRFAEQHDHYAGQTAHPYVEQSA